MNNIDTYQQKEKELFLILKRLNEWNQNSQDSMDQAYSIIEENQQAMKRIEAWDNKMSEMELREFSKKHQSYMEAIVIKQKQLIEKMKKQSIHLEKQLGQMNQKSKVAKQYMNKDQSLFIDKDM